MDKTTTIPTIYMTWQFSIYAIPIFIAAFIAVAIAIPAWRRREAPGGALFAALVTAVALRTLSYGLQLTAVNRSAQLFWSNVEISAGTAVPIIWVVFALEYTRHNRWLRRHWRQGLLLLILPISIWGLVWTDASSHLARETILLVERHNLTFLQTEYTTLFTIAIIIVQLHAVAGILLLAQALVRAPAIYRKQTAALLVAVALPLIGSIIANLNLIPQLDLELAPFLLVISGIIMYWALLRYRLLAIVPVARAIVVQGLHNGIYVLDPGNYLVDINIIGEEWLEQNSHSVLGRPAHQVFADWPEILSILENNQEIYTELPLNTLLPDYAFSAALTRLENEDGKY
ncbi:MAG: histidine kinase N-terminal 7TM domain-containing protein, partial [Anaerolineae bacterium]